MLSVKKKTQIEGNKESQSQHKFKKFSLKKYLLLSTIHDKMLFRFWVTDKRRTYYVKEKTYALDFVYYDFGPYGTGLR